MRVVSLICANGLGHFRRSIGLLSRLLALHPTLEATICCAPWQPTRMREWARLAELRASPRVSWRHEIVPDEPLWTAEGVSPSSLVLTDWEARLEGLPELTDAALVLSDNLTGVLDRRPDAVLLGSFLWSEVLAARWVDAPSIARFASAERERLERHRPVMLCVGAAATPAVAALPGHVGVPWMADGPFIDTPIQPGVGAFLGGATGALRSLLAEAAAGLRTLGLRGRCEGAILDAAPDTDADRLEHTAAALGACEFAVLRPGMGSITDCVAQRVPMVAIRERDNLESIHLAGRIEALGLGVSSAPDLDSILGAVVRLRSDLPRHRSALRDQAIDGLDRAAAWLLTNRLSTSVGPA